MALLLEVKKLVKFFQQERAFSLKRSPVIRAVDNISFSLSPGEALGLVGESGCGKTTVIKLIARLLEPTSGEIVFKGVNITHYSGQELRELRRKLQVVFQNPYSSLNPRFTVFSLIEEPLLVHGIGDKDVRSAYVHKLLREVGLERTFAQRLPYELSGGERQRVAIARALATSPELLLLDEPVSALDVSVQAQILSLLERLRRNMKLTYLIVSHDLSVVGKICQKVAVMYLGKIVEFGTVKKIFNEPFHPYTQALISAIPVLDLNSSKKARRFILTGEVIDPSKSGVVSGCRFQHRCPLVLPICRRKEPRLTGIEEGRKVACFFSRPNPLGEDVKTELFLS
jgi:oligopeptide transport system ATP-binding protein